MQTFQKHKMNKRWENFKLLIEFNFIVVGSRSVSVM